MLCHQPDTMESTLFFFRLLRIRRLSEDSNLAHARKNFHNCHIWYLLFIWTTDTCAFSVGNHLCPSFQAPKVRYFNFSKFITALSIKFTMIFITSFEKWRRSKGKCLCLVRIYSHVEQKIFWQHVYSQQIFISFSTLLFAAFIELYEEWFG